MTPQEKYKDILHVLRDRIDDAIDQADREVRLADLEGYGSSLVLEALAQVINVEVTCLGQDEPDDVRLTMVNAALVAMCSRISVLAKADGLRVQLAVATSFAGDGEPAPEHVPQNLPPTSVTMARLRAWFDGGPAKRSLLWGRYGSKQHEDKSVYRCDLIDTTVGDGDEPVAFGYGFEPEEALVNALKALKDRQTRDEWESDADCGDSA